MNKWRNPLIVSIIFLLICLSIWMSSRAKERDENSEIRCYGGEVPDAIQIVLERLNEKLEGSKGILTAQSNQLVFIDREGLIRKYSYTDGTLWNDDCPAVANVGNFYFEYRNGMGDRLTRTQERMDTIKKVGYSIRLTRKNQEIIAYSTVNLVPAVNEEPLHNTMLLVYQ